MFITSGDAVLFSPAFGPTGAPAILAQGGWTGSWELWLPTLSLLSDHHRVIGLDHRGSGSAVAAASSITLDALVDDLPRVLDAHRIDRCTLAGESMGGAVAILAAARYPDRFERLVLVAPATAGSVAQGAADEPDAFELAIRADYAAAKERFVHRCVPEPDADHVRRWGIQILDRASTEAAIALWRVVRRLDVRAAARDLGQPTLVIQGSLDVIVPPASSEALVATMRDARLVRLEGAGHAPTMTRAADVAAAIEAFLDGSGVG